MLFNWNKRTRRVPHNGSITIRVYEPGKVSIYFHSGTEKLITNSGYIQWGFSSTGKQIGFCEAESGSGYKASTAGHATPRIQMSPPPAALEKFKLFEGSYDYEVDEESGTIYIDVRNKKVTRGDAK